MESWYSERGIIARLRTVVHGLSKPRSSPEYKLARTELQRLKAPIIGIMLPVIGVIVLIVVTAVQGQKKEHIIIDVAVADEQTAELVDEPDPPEEEVDMTQDIDVNVDIATDVPTPDIAAPSPPSPTPGGEPDKVAAAPSPVTMASIAGTMKIRGVGDGNGGDFGSIIGGGKSQNTEGCLIGIIIDFKFDAKGQPRLRYREDPRRRGWWISDDYWADCKNLLDNNFSPVCLAQYNVAPKRTATNKIFIPAQSAGNGPKSFGAEQSMKSSSFCCYYSGKIRATEDGVYRFVGYFDDMMVVRVDKKVVFEDNWAHKGKDVKGWITGWASSDPDSGKWPSFQGMHSGMQIGDWVKFSKGKEYFIEVMCGERPGGEIGGVLLIQQQGKQYENSHNHPVLPVFASRPLSIKEKERIRNFAYKMSDDSPRFNSRKASKAEKEQLIKGDVDVTVDI